MFGIGMHELIIILIIVLLVFGANRLPELASGLGKSIRIFKREINSTSGSDNDTHKG